MPGAPANQPCLTVLGGPMSGTQFLLEDSVDDILIGSDSSCRFCIPLPGVSPIHARIWLDAGGAIVYDTHSPRGLFVNDDRVSGQAPLKNGDILWLGTPGEEAVVMIQCRLPRAAPAAEPPTPTPEREAPVEATVVMASEPLAAPPGESEFYVEVDAGRPAVVEPEEAAPPAAPEPSPVEATTVLEVAAAEAVEPPTPARLTPDLPAPLPVVENEFEDETFEVVAAAPPAPQAPAAAVPEETPTVAVTAARPLEPSPIPSSPPPAPARPEPPATRPKPAISPKPAHAMKPPSPPAPAPRPTPPPASSPLRGIVLAAGILAVLGVGGVFAWRWLRPARTALVTPPQVPPATRPVATVPASPLATPPPALETPPAPPVEEVVTIVRSPSPKAPSPSPPAAKPSPSPKGGPTAAPVTTPAGPSPEELRAQQVAAQVAGLLGQAEAAKPEEALRLYDEVLKLEPQNARAATGRASAQAAAAASRKRLAAGRTSVQSAKSKADLSGFDSADVQVADAPGRIDFEASPASPKPGDSYTVRIFFVNEAKKSIKVKSLSVSTLTNGARAGGLATSRTREVAAGQRALLDEVSGSWKDGTSSWSLEVVVVSDRNDTYRNQVTWR